MSAKVVNLTEYRKRRELRRTAPTLAASLDALAEFNEAFSVPEDKMPPWARQLWQLRIDADSIRRKGD